MISRYSLPDMKGIWSDENKFNTWLKIELLACEALCELGDIPEKSLKKIKDKSKFDIKRIHQIEKVVKHDVIAFLTSISEKVGKDARFIHMGLTSSDVLDTALSYNMTQAVDLLLKDLQNLRTALKKLAKKHKTTIMIGRSHGVHAEPMTFGLKMLLWFDEVGRHIHRLEHARNTIKYGKISGAVGTYANIDPYVEQYVCKKLGLSPSPLSTQVLQRDRHAELMTTLGLIASSLEKFATEIRALQRTEVNEAQEFFAKGQKGSSAMPHKKNPIICERICGLARLVRANSIPAMENISLWHERDISHSSVERVIIPDSTIALDYMLSKFTGIVKNLVVNTKNMKKNIDKTKGSIFSQTVLLKLIKKGLIRESAYKIVQQSAMKSTKEKRDFKTAILKNKKICNILSIEEIEESFDIKIHLKNVEEIYKRFGI
ncbi:adenylosuccinate lyase [bacterium]|nr:adenylosuccinate lyase [bacterium]